MKLKVITALLVAVLSAAWVRAQEARVFRMTGNKTAMVLLPDADEESPLTEGQVVPVGSVITVGEGTKLFLKTFEGAITTASAGSVFEIAAVEMTADGHEKTTLDLKNGDLVANLDPAKRGTHDYGVRTPKGVAAARGTDYSVSVAGLTVLVTVIDGQVSFSIPDIPAPVLLVPGTASSGGPSVTLAQALSDPATAQATTVAMQATAAAVAALSADPSTGVTAAMLNQVMTTVALAGASAGNNAFVAVVAAAATQANPAVATQVVQTVAANNAGAAATTVASVTKQVVAASTTGATVQQVSQSLASAANSASGTNLVNAAAVESAVNQSIQNDAKASTPGATKPATGTGSTNTGSTKPETTTNSANPTTGTANNDIPNDAPQVEVPVDNIIVSPSS